MNADNDEKDRAKEAEGPDHVKDRTHEIGIYGARRKLRERKEDQGREVKERTQHTAENGENSGGDDGA